MRSNSRRLRAAAAALAAVALVAVGPGMASADEHDSLKDVLTSIGRDAQPPSPDAGQPQDGTGDTPSSTTPPSSSDDDSEGHETEDPSAPDHGRGTVGDVEVQDQDLATIADSDGTVEDDDSTKADSTLLAIGGQEIMGAHADSSGTKESHFGDPLAPLCDGSEGQVCLRLLYADAWATDDGNTSSSHSQSGVADACLGGTNTDPAAECDGQASVGVLSSHGHADRDQASGRTTASSKSGIADVCLKDDPATEGCALGAGALHSGGGADSGGDQAAADRESYLLAVDAGGKEQGRYGDPTDISLPPGCPTGASLVCVFLNQGETYVGKGTAGHAQEALHLDVLPGNLDLIVELSRSESLVHNDGGEAPATTPSGGTAAPGGSGGPGMPGGGGGSGVLPNTGGVWSGLLALGLGGVGVGALLTAYGRRRALGLA